MWEGERDRYRQECDEKGISWARAVLPDRLPGIQVHIREWIDERERVDAAEAAADQRRLAQDAIDAARDAATVSKEAAIAARNSARWTMVAAMIAGIGILVTVAQGFGWIPKS